MKTIKAFFKENCILFLLLFLDMFFFLPKGNIVRTFYVFLFMVFVPGMSFLPLIRTKLNFLEFFSLSVALSVSLSIAMFEIIGFLFSLDSVSILIVYNVLVLLSHACATRKPRFRVSAIPGKTIGLFIISLLFVSSLPVFYIFNPYLSFVSDGWKHASIINELSRFDIPPSNPRFSGNPLFYPWGYHLFAATGLSLSGADIVTVYNFFSAFSIVLLFLSGFYFSKRILHKDSTAVLSGLLMSSMSGLSLLLLIKDFFSGTLFGTDELLKFVWHYTHSLLSTIPFGPSTIYSMSLMLFSLALFLQYLKSRNPAFLFLGIVVTFSIFIIEPVPIPVILMSLFAFFLLDVLSKPRIKTTLPYIYIFLLLAVVYFLSSFIYHPITSSSLRASFIIRNSISDIIMIYGIPLMLSVGGILLSLKQRKKEYIFMFVFFVALYVLYNHVDYSIPLDYRFMLYLFIPIGVFSSLFIDKTILSGRRTKTKKSLLFVLLVASFSATYLSIFIYSCATPSIAEDTLAASQWIMDNTPQDAIFLTNPYHYHTYVSAFGRRRVFLGAYKSVSVYSSTFGSNSPEERLSVALQIFNTTNSSYAAMMMDEYNISHIFLCHHEFIEFSSTQLAKFLDKEHFTPVYDSGECLIIKRGASSNHDIKGSSSLSLLNARDKCMHNNVSCPCLSLAESFFEKGSYSLSLVFSKKALAECNEAAMSSKENSIREYIKNPFKIASGFLIGLSYYLLLILLIVNYLCRMVRMKIKTIMRVSISLIVLLIIFSNISIPLFINNIQKMNTALLFPIACFIPLSIIVRSYRLKLILNKNSLNISLLGSCRLNLIGASLNIFMPASSGDIVKAYYGYRRYKLKEGMLSSVMVDKLIALFAILIIGLISSILLKIYVFSITFAVLALVFYFLTFHPRSIPWGAINRLIRFALKKNLNTQKLTESYKIPNKLKTSALVLSFLGWVLTYIQFYLICRAFSVDVGFFYVLVIAPLITLARIFPLTFVGFGSQEAVVIYLFTMLNIIPAVSVLISLSFTFLNVILPGIAGTFLIATEKNII